MQIHLFFSNRIHTATQVRTLKLIPLHLKVNGDEEERVFSHALRRKITRACAANDGKLLALPAQARKMVNIFLSKEAANRKRTCLTHFLTGRIRFFVR